MPQSSDGVQRHINQRKNNVNLLDEASDTPDTGTAGLDIVDVTLVIEQPSEIGRGRMLRNYTTTLNERQNVSRPALLFTAG